MSKISRVSLLVLLVGVFVLSACGGTSEVKYVDGIPDYGCLGSAEDALVDLECQEITMAVENAYLPFNYIVTETMQAEGWDYEVFTEICERLHCQPVFVETVWETMVQQVQEGQFVMRMAIFQLDMSILLCVYW